MPHHYFKTYPAKWKGKGLTHTEKYILSIIDSFLVCDAKNGYFADELEMSVWSVKQYLKQLHEKNIIKITYQGNPQSPKTRRILETV
jgi:DNA-binding transcriptional regulator LsrR (DeoR family)